MNESSEILEREVREMMSSLTAASPPAAAPAAAPAAPELPLCPAIIELVRGAAPDSEIARVVSRLSLHSERGSSWSASWNVVARDADGVSALQHALHRRRSADIVLALLRLSPDGARTEQPAPSTLQLALIGRYEAHVVLPILQREPEACAWPFTTDGRLPLYHALMHKTSANVVTAIYVAHRPAADFVDVSGTTMLALAQLRRHPTAVIDLFVNATPPPYLRANASIHRLMSDAERQGVPRFPHMWRRGVAHMELRGAGSSPRIPGTIRTYGDGPTLMERAQASREASTVWLAQAQGLTDRAAFAVPDALRAGRTSLGAENSVLRQAHDAKMRSFARKFAPTFTQPLRSYYASGTMLRATVGYKYQIPSLPRSSRRDR